MADCAVTSKNFILGGVVWEEKIFQKRGLIAVLKDCFA